MAFMSIKNASANDLWSNLERRMRSRRRSKRVRDVLNGDAKKLPGGDSLVVSLTSFGDRIQTVHLAIKSLMMQSVLPDKIVLYLGADSDGISLPKELEMLQESGLEIVRGVEDIRAHKKYFYAMKEYPRSRIITIDDDAIYTSDLVKTLQKWSARYPDQVIARRAHRIAVKDNVVLPYCEWQWDWAEDNPVPRKSLLATGVGGVLYPPSCFDERAFDPDVFMNICQHNDDVWLKCAETFYGIGTVWARNDCPHPYTIDGTQEIALWKVNVDGGENDVQMRNVMKHFGLSPEAFVDSAASSEMAT